VEGGWSQSAVICYIGYTGFRLWCSQTFSFIASDPDGSADLKWLGIIFNGVLNGVRACYVAYNVVGNYAALADDSGTTSTLVRLGTADRARNSQCTLSGEGSSVAFSDSSLTLNLALTFEPTFAGSKNIYMYALDSAGSGTGFVLRGTWRVSGPNRPPTVVAATPSAGSGTGRTFSFVFADPDGYSDLTWVGIIVNSVLNGVRACYVLYSVAGGYAALVNDEGTAATVVRPGRADVAENSQCRLAGVQSSAAVTDSTLTLYLAVTFQPAFAGAKNIYMYAQDRAEVITGFLPRGTWTVP